MSNGMPNVPDHDPEDSVTRETVWGSPICILSCAVLCLWLATAVSPLPVAIFFALLFSIVLLSLLVYVCFRLARACTRSFTRGQWLKGSLQLALFAASALATILYVCANVT